MLQIVVAALAALALAIPGGMYGGWGGAVFFGLASGLVAYVVIGRRVSKRLARVTAPVERYTRAGRVDRAIAAIESARPLAKWQLGIGRAIDGQIGVLMYAQKGDARAARPYLERAPRRLWQAQAMLAAIHFKAGRRREMREVFERAIRKNRKVGLLYAAYAHCEHALGRRAEAMDILARGTQRVPGDARLRDNLLAVQNRKKPRARSYGADWWSLGLEAPPRAATQPPPGVRPRRR